jgi:RimJ/RimL family protein N-acetyltransferase
MRHSLQVEDFGIRLRPVRMEDAGFIVWLRNLDYVRGKVGDSAASLAGQKAWLEKYFERDGDYYFIVETLGGIALGTHGIYDVRGTSAEKGRHIVRPEVMAGVPAGLLATDLGFGKLGLSELRATCVSTNVAVHSLHRRSGFKDAGIIRAAQTINGQPVDLVQFLLKPEDWAGVRESIVPLARLAGTRVMEWEKTQTIESQPWIETKIGK